jgi:hypothetical protein
MPGTFVEHKYNVNTVDELVQSGLLDELLGLLNELVQSGLLDELLGLLNELVQRPDYWMS